jgi:hypothetical protein
MRRKRMGAKQSKRVFRKGSEKIRSINTMGAFMRGGIRF